MMVSPWPTRWPDVAPGLGTFKYRDTLLCGSNNFGVLVVDSGSADNAVCPLNVFGSVADGNGDPRLFQMVSGFALIHVRAGDMDAHAVKHHAQRTHGYAADANEMDMLSGLQERSHF